MRLEADAKLLISVVRRSRGARVVQLAREAGATGSTVLFGRGTAQNSILRILCLADAHKDVVFTIAPESIMKAIIMSLRTAPDLCRRTPGIGIVVDVLSLARSGTGFVGGGAMSGDYSRELVCAIVNSGFADDIMLAARKAGAKGGTIIRARGTASGQDSSFFGITIVPEKEMLLILTPKAETATLISAISACPCLAEPGVGIVFTVPVTEFFPLGLKANS